MAQVPQWAQILVIVLSFAVPSAEIWSMQHPPNLPLRWAWLSLYGLHVGLFLMRNAQWRAIVAYPLAMVVWVQYCNVALRPYLPVQAALVDYLVQGSQRWIITESAWLILQHFRMLGPLQPPSRNRRYQVNDDYELE